MVLLIRACNHDDGIASYRQTGVVAREALPSKLTSALTMGKRSPVHHLLIQGGYLPSHCFNVLLALNTLT